MVPGKGDEKTNDASAGEDSGRSRRVYVGNLAWQVDWRDLKDLFKTTGHEVTRADVMQTRDGRSKGCGIVEFATVEGAQQAVLTLNDTELKGRQIFVREDRENSRGSGGKHGPGTSSSNAAGGVSSPSTTTFSSDDQAQSRRVYVGNLSWDVQWQDLKDHMKSAGAVVHAEVICEQSGRSKGCGIVEYATAEEAQKAMANLSHTELNGRMIFVREDREGGSTPAAGPSATMKSTAASTATTTTTAAKVAAASPKPPPSTTTPVAPSPAAAVAAAPAPAAKTDGAPESKASSNSVYVWNLSYDTDWKGLKDHFRQAGDVDNATILTNHDGRSIGCAVVSFLNSDDAARAIRELQDSDLDGRPIRLREDRGGGTSGAGGKVGTGRSSRGRGRGGGGRGFGGESGLQIYVSNISSNTDWRKLKDHFKRVADVDRADARPGKFGTIRFYSKEDAAKAIEQLNGVELDGCALEVRLDQKA